MANANDLAVVIADFIDKEILRSITSEWKRWAIGGLGAIGSNVIAEKLNANKEKMMKFGIMNEAGEINIGNIRKFTDGAFHAQPNVSINLQGLIGLPAPFSE